MKNKKTNNHQCFIADHQGFALMVGNSGYAVLTSVMFFMFISAIIISGASSVSYKESKSSKDFGISKKSFFMAESGVEDLAYRAIKGKQYNATEVLSLDGYFATTTVANVGGFKEITATGTALKMIRKTKIKLKNSNNSNVSFHYGIQVGSGGLRMENSSHITGNVFSNGPIIGESLNIIRGDVVSAGTGGSIKKIQSYGSAYAHSIEDATIDENAYYVNIDDTYVGGTKYPNSTDQATTSLPITDAILDQLKNEASVNVINSPCPYVINSETTVGPVKINCNLKIKNSSTITIAGNIWVVGNIEVENSPTIQLANSLGDNSVAIIADNPSNRTTSSKIEMKSTPEFRKNSLGDGYFLFISQNNSSELGGDENAISVSGSVSGNVLVNATKGKIELSSSAFLKEVSGHKIKLKNGSEVLYETGLANLLFSSGPSGGYSIDGWKEE